MIGTTERVNRDVSLIWRLLKQARRYWPHIGGHFLLTLLATPLALLVPVPLKLAIDSVLGDAPLPGFLDAVLPSSVTASDGALLLGVAVMLVVITALVQLQSVSSSLLSTWIGEKVLIDVRSQLFRRSQRLSLAYHDSKGSADSTYRIQYDAMAVQSLAIGSLSSIVTSALTVGAMLYVTARLDWQLALVALTVTPLLLTVVQIYRHRLREQSRDVKKLESSALSIVQEVLGALRVVKAFGQEDREEERFFRRSSEGMRARLKLAWAEGWFGLLVGLVTGVGTAVVLYIGVRHVRSGALRLGELWLVMSYLAALYSPLKSIAKKLGRLQSSLASAERTFELLDMEPEVVERPHARKLKRAIGHIEFRGVVFAYDGSHPVLRDVSFEVPAAASVGIAGRTGAGKTTLLNLLMRFYDPLEGHILLDGVDLRDYRVVDLREQFALVLQEPVLFSASIGDNIAYARPEASFEDVVAAARAANVHDFIERLPEGYETLVGERGMRLSGGERQRVALARAFLKDAPILILDEPTSSVDVKTEEQIMEAMKRLMEGRTTLMIAHRLSTLEHCDARIELDDGRLTQAPPEGEGEAEVAAVYASRRRWR